MELFSYDQLLSLGWNVEQIIQKVYEVEHSQLGEVAYSVDELKQLYQSGNSGGYLLFADTTFETPIAHTIFCGITSVDGVLAQRIASTCVIPHHMGNGYGVILDQHSETHAIKNGLKWRVTRSWAPPEIYRKLTGLQIGSPHNSALRFRLKRGFRPMTHIEIEQWFPRQTQRFHEICFHHEICDGKPLIVSEMEIMPNGQPALLLPMIKDLK